MTDRYQPPSAPSQPPAPTAAPKPAPSKRAPREVPVQLVTVTMPEPQGDIGDDVPTELRWRFIVEGTEAQARDWLSARFVQVRRATPQDLIDAGRDGVPFEKAGGGEGGAS